MRSISIILILILTCGIAFAATAEECFQKGRDFFKDGAYEKAIDEYKKAIEINPNYFDAYSNIGLCYSALRQHQNVITYLKEAVKINPDNADSYLGLGITYHALGQYQQAKYNWEKAKALYEKQENTIGTEKSENCIKKLYADGLIK